MKTKLTRAFVLATLVGFGITPVARGKSMFTGSGVLSDYTARRVRAGAPTLDPIRGEIYRNKGAIEAQARTEILKAAANFRELRGFYIDYGTLQCVTPHPEHGAAPLVGACVALARAFQLSAQVALNVSRDGIHVQALSTVIE